MGRTAAVGATAIALAIASATSAAPARAIEPGSRLDWMAGHWCGGDGERIEEAWLPQAGGMLLGMARTVRDGKAVEYELMRIVVDGDRATFIAQVNGGAPVAFEAVASGEGWIRFGNPAHDFPQTVEYRRAGDRLDAWVAGPGADGKELRIPFGYRNCQARD